MWEFLKVFYHFLIWSTIKPNLWICGVGTLCANAHYRVSLYFLPENWTEITFLTIKSVISRFFPWSKYNSYKVMESRLRTSTLILLDNLTFWHRKLYEIIALAVIFVQWDTKKSFISHSEQRQSGFWDKLDKQKCLSHLIGYGVWLINYGVWFGNSLLASKFLFFRIDPNWGSFDWWTNYSLFPFKSILLLQNQITETCNFGNYRTFLILNFKLTLRPLLKHKK